MTNIPLDGMYKRKINKDKQPISNRFQELTYRIFSTQPDGIELLKLWKEAYINQPRFIPGMDPYMGYYRSGQESIVLGILALIEEQKKLNDLNKPSEEK